MHQFEVHDVEVNMWKRYDQIFNIRKFRQDSEMLDKYFEEDPD